MSRIIDIINNDLEYNSKQIKNPSRYTKGKIECWDYIIDQNMNFLEGCVVKYITRYKEKNGIEDLEKAKIFIDKIIDTMR